MRYNYKGKDLGEILKAAGFDWKTGQAVLQLRRYGRIDIEETRKVELAENHELLALRSWEFSSPIKFEGKAWHNAAVVAKDANRMYFSIRYDQPKLPWHIATIQLDMQEYLVGTEIDSISENPPA